jgi:hypothetical protein
MIYNVLKNPFYPTGYILAVDRMVDELFAGRVNYWPNIDSIPAVFQSNMMHLALPRQVGKTYYLNQLQRKLSESGSCLVVGLNQYMIDYFDKVPKNLYEKSNCMTYDWKRGISLNINYLICDELQLHDVRNILSLPAMQTSLHEIKVVSLYTPV